MAFLNLEKTHSFSVEYVRFLLDLNVVSGTNVNYAFYKQ